MSKHEPRPSDEVVQAIAGDILSMAAYTPRPQEDGPRDLALAYATQDALVAHLLARKALGPVAGYKIAANAPALMKRFGVTEPASGRVFAKQRHASPAVLPASGFRQFAYEPEIAAVIGSDLPAREAPHSTERVVAAIARFVPALELLDLRGAEMEAIHLPDIVAQNITNAGAVIGGPGITPDQLNADAIRTTVEIDGVSELSVIGAAPQPPLEAVAWLANHLAARGLSLEAGQIVLCGTHAPIRYVRGPATITAEMQTLGSVTLRLE